MEDNSRPTDNAPEPSAKWPFVLLFVTAGLVPLSFAGAPYPLELTLQHVPTIAILAMLTAGVRRGWLSNASSLCVLAFLWLHLVGARWLYSYVPYDEWLRPVLGISMSEYFGWQRNHYDRLVHAAFGILGVPPAAEMLCRYGGMRRRGAAVIAVAVVLAMGSIYEIVEWLLAVVLSPAQAESYNGQQGDLWDPQKDMALAWLGAMCSAILQFLRVPRR